MPDPVFDPTLPADHSPLSAAEMRDQLNALNARLSALEAQVPNFAVMPTLPNFNPSFHNPPTLQDVQQIGNYLHDLAFQLEGGTW